MAPAFASLATPCKHLPRPGYSKACPLPKPISRLAIQGPFAEPNPDSNTKKCFASGESIPIIAINNLDFQDIRTA